MIKFRIYPKIWERKKCKFEKVLENVKIIGLLDILNRMNDNMGKKCGVTMVIKQSLCNNFNISKTFKDVCNTQQNFTFIRAIVFEIAGGRANTLLVKVVGSKSLVKEGLLHNSSHR